MTIKTVLSELENASHPVARVLHKGEHSKVLVIGFKKNMKLKDHATHIPAKLVALQGYVVYNEGLVRKELHQFEETEIPKNTIHSVEALEDSLCLLIQG